MLCFPLSLATYGIYTCVDHHCLILRKRPNQSAILRMEIQPFHKPKGIHNAIIQKGWSKWVIEVEQLWFTRDLWKSIKTYWTYGSTCSSLLYFRQIKITHRLGLGQGENGEMFQQQQKKHPSASRSCCCARSWPWMLDVFLRDTDEKCRRDDNWCMLMIPVASTVHP